MYGGFDTIMSYFSFGMFLNKSDSKNAIWCSTSFFFAFFSAISIASSDMSIAVISESGMYFASDIAIAPTSCA